MMKSLIFFGNQFPISNNLSVKRTFIQRSFEERRLTSNRSWVRISSEDVETIFHASFIIHHLFGSKLALLVKVILQMGGMVG